MSQTSDYIDFACSLCPYRGGTLNACEVEGSMASHRVLRHPQTASVADADLVRRLLDPATVGQGAEEASAYIESTRQMIWDMARRSTLSGTNPGLHGQEAERVPAWI